MWLPSPPQKSLWYKIILQALEWPLVSVYCVLQDWQQLQGKELQEPEPNPSAQSNHESRAYPQLLTTY